jgi:Putative sensor
VTPTQRGVLWESLLAPTRAGTWLNVLYLLLAFPFGLLYFVFLIIGGSLGLGLALFAFGVPLLLITVGAWWIFAALERLLARGLLGMDLPDAPRPWEAAEGVLAKARAHFTSPATWKDLAFVLLKLPLGLFSTVVLIAAGGAATALLVGPALGPWTTGHTALIGLWHVDHWWEALISVALGLVMLEITLLIANGLATLWRAVVLALLDDDPHAAVASAGQNINAPRTDA